MFTALLKILPVLLTFLLGYALKRAGRFEQKDGSKLLQLVFYATVPFLVLKSLTEATLDVRFSILPLSLILLTSVSYIAAMIVKKKFDYPKEREGVFVMASMFVNSGFVLPFIISSLGSEGVARVSLFDIANNIVVYGFGYTVAIKYSSNAENTVNVLKKLASSPVLYAVVLGLLMNVLSIRIPMSFQPFVENVGNMTGPLIMLALGMLFQPKLLNLKPALVALALRMGLGLLVGLAIISIFNLSGVDQKTLLLLAAAPIGFNTVTFAALENLDEEFATNIVSIGLIAGLIVIPLLTVLLG